MVAERSVEEALGGREKLKNLVEGYSVNVAAYNDLLDKLLKEHMHEWVAISNGEIIGTAKSRSRLLKEIGDFEAQPASLLLRYVEEPRKVHLY